MMDILQILIGIILCINLFLSAVWPIYVYHFIKRKKKAWISEADINPSNFIFGLYILVVLCFLTPIFSIPKILQHAPLSQVQNFVLWLIAGAVLFQFVGGPILFILLSLEERRYTKLKNSQLSNQRDIVSV